MNIVIYYDDAHKPVSEPTETKVAIPEIITHAVTASLYKASCNFSSELVMVLLPRIVV